MIRTIIATATIIAVATISVLTAASAEAYDPDPVPDNGDGIIELLPWDPTLQWSEAGHGMVTRTDDSYVALFIAAVEQDTTSVSINIDIDGEVKSFPCEVHDFPLYRQDYGYEGPGRTAIIAVPEHSEFWHFIGSPVDYIYLGATEGKIYRDFFPVKDMYFYNAAIETDSPHGVLFDFSADSDWTFWLEVTGEYLGYHFADII